MRVWSVTYYSCLVAFKRSREQRPGTAPSASALWAAALEFGHFGAFLPLIRRGNPMGAPVAWNAGGFAMRFSEWNAMLVLNTALANTANSEATAGPHP